MKNSADKRLVDLYLSNTDMLEEGLPHAVNRRRSEAMESFNLLGLPPKGSGNGDRYHYTDLRSRFTEDLELYFTPSYPAAPAAEELPLEGYRITLVNGFHRGAERLTRLDNGIVYGSLAAAAGECGELVERYYDRIADHADDALAALNTAFMQDGAFIYVPERTYAELPFVIDYGYYAEGEPLLSFGRNLIVLEAQAEARIVVRGHTLSGERFVGCMVSEVSLGWGSRAEVVGIGELNACSTQVHSWFARQQQQSTLQTLSVALGGSLVRSNQKVELAGRGAENHTYGLYIACGEEHLDYMTDIGHMVPDCTSYEHFKGIAAGQGTGVFNGRIYVAADAQQTQAFQQNNNLLLGDSAHIYTKPQLEIYADNVKCSHGATVGQLDEEAIYYMRQRGIGEEDARRLQMSGFVHDVIGKCSIEGLCQVLDAKATAKIESL